MSTSEELISMIERFVAGECDEVAITKLSQRLRINGNQLQSISQDGKFNTAIGEIKGGNIYIGDRIQVDFEALQKLLARSTEIDWHSVSDLILLRQTERLTSNNLTHVEGVSYQTEQVFVPLGLVERRKQPRQKNDVLPEKGSSLYEETEIIRKFEHKAFLNQVLRHGQSAKSNGQRIAIIGEPGAGKTTLLQQISRWVSNNMDRAITIWVSLADLKGETIEHYLLQNWLQAAVRTQGYADASTQIKNIFVKLFSQGNVWLFLDGVDEMYCPGGNPLQEVEKQLRSGGLLPQAKVILTCRTNLWDGNHHGLDTFDIYRTLDFSYPIQVEDFIHKWFESFPGDQSRLGEKLCLALKQPDKQRIQDLVKNPLRLTMICFNWSLKEGSLPESKAGLYRQAMADFYDWKRTNFSTTNAQREQLNKALGELAREAIDGKGTRFRFGKNFVESFLGEAEEPKSLFWMALKLGWLNQVGVEYNSRDKAYAFFHPTFQEYFSALSIEDPHFFLNHFPDEPSRKDSAYRIFEPHWQEIYSLWLGRHSIRDEVKDSLIAMLVEFEDTTDAYYRQRAILIAAVGIAEYRKSNKAKQLIEQLVIWTFGNWYPDRGWLYSLPSLSEEAKKALLRTDKELSVEEMIDYVQLFPEKRTSIQFLGELGTGSPRAISFLEHLLESSEDDATILQVAESLMKLDNKHQKAADILLYFLEKEDRWQAEETLKVIERIDSELHILLPGLIELAKKSSVLVNQVDLQLEPSEEKSIYSNLDNLSKPEKLCGIAVQCLGSVGANNTEVTDLLIELLNMCDSEHVKGKVVESLGKVGADNGRVVGILIEIVKTSGKSTLVRHSAKALGENTIHLDRISEALLYALQRGLYYTDFRVVSESLVKVSASASDRREKTINILLSILEEKPNYYITTDICNGLGELAYGDNRSIQALTELLDITEPGNTYYFAARNLVKVSPGNRKAVKRLENQLVEKDQFDWEGCVAAVELGKIIPDHSIALDYLIHAIIKKQLTIQPKSVSSDFVLGSTLNLADEVKWVTTFLDFSRSADSCKTVAAAVKDVLSAPKDEALPEDFWVICLSILRYCSSRLSYREMYEIVVESQATSV